MCELFGLSSNRPVLPVELLCRFGARGGDTADNPDGWGLAVLEGNAFHLAKEPLPAARSPRFRELCRQTRSSLILGHVRKANPPTARVLANTHPFSRVCCGREWVFAHNGIISDSNALAAKNTASLCKVSGDTDSEHAFCVVLERIAKVFSASSEATDRGWLDTLAGVAETLASHGRFNFLMSNGEHLIAYGHDRLHGLAGTRTTVIATEPLTAVPGWTAFKPGELRVYRDGERIARFLTHPHPVITTAPADGARQPMRT
jgi:predicted glutamine amidotransferase